MKFILIVTFLLGPILPFITFSDTLTLKESYPKVYTVKKTDTLWDISEKFLMSPWLWPRLWHANSQISNPHLIYPGEVLTLVWIGNKPQLTRKRIIKISPIVRKYSQNDPIPTIPLSSIAAFLSRDHIVELTQLEGAPRILGDAVGTPRFFEGDIFYGERNFDKKKLYGIYRVGDRYENLKTGEGLGQAITFIGLAEVSKNKHVKSSEKVTPFDFIKSRQDAQQGDLILPIPEYETYPAYFIPQPVSEEITGHIVATLNNRMTIGKWDAVVIDKGVRDNIQIGSVFAILRHGVGVMVAKDKISYYSDGNKIQKVGGPDLLLPPEQIGELLVFKVYKKVSIALVMRSSYVMRPRDIIHGLNF
ncbi:MAG: LysM peptidoglycan-binding domain-containing protein [Psychromonas sp.]|nr:LysM peptidoglycan-binding domain-containing protein [Psychromonas sp.]